MAITSSCMTWDGNGSGFDVTAITNGLKIVSQNATAPEISIQNNNATNLVFVFSLTTDGNSNFSTSVRTGTTVNYSSSYTTSSNPTGTYRYLVAAGDNLYINISGNTTPISCDLSLTCETETIINGACVKYLPAQSNYGLVLSANTNFDTADVPLSFTSTIQNYVPKMVIKIFPDATATSYSINNSTPYDIAFYRNGSASATTIIPSGSSTLSDFNFPPYNYGDEVEITFLNRTGNTSGLFNGAINGYFNCVADVTKTPPPPTGSASPTPTPTWTPLPTPSPTPSGPPQTPIPTIAGNPPSQLWAWGRNANSIYGSAGWLGDDSALHRSSPVQVGSLNTWTVIHNGAGYFFGHYLQSDNTLWGMGFNSSYYLGDNTTTGKSSPIQIFAGSSFKSIANSIVTTVGIKTDGTMWSWGGNTSGSMGVYGTLAVYSSPVQIGTESDWQEVFGNYNYAHAAIKTDGTLWAWGLNTNNQLGDNTTIAARSSPVIIAAGEKWKTVGLGISFGIGITQDGRLWSWGTNSFGQLGINQPTTTRRPYPEILSNANDWSAVYAQGNSAFGLKTDGTLYAWGRNSFGQLGDGTVVSRSSPVIISPSLKWRSIGLDYQAAVVAGVTTDYKLYTWGAGIAGAAGNNTTTNSSSPTQIGTDNTWIAVNGVLDSMHALKSAVPIPSASPTPTSTLTPTPTPSATPIGYLLYMWGKNGYGQLGDNSTISKSSPVQIGIEETWVSVSEGYGPNIFATKNDGTIWCWGYNDSGQLGIDSISNISSPVQFGNINDWSMISQGYTFTMGLKNNGTLWTWGRNNRGQLGLSNTINKSSPTQVGTESNWSFVDANFSMATALKTDGTLWMWGANYKSRFGISPNRSSPIQITAHTWTKVSSGYPHWMGIKTDGTLWGIGGNNLGELGNNSSTIPPFNQSTLVQECTLSSNWTDVKCGYRITIAKKSDGTLWSWGENTLGSLGTGDSVHRSSPVQITFNLDYTNFDITNATVACLQPNGFLWLWGNNAVGNLGNNNITDTSSPVQTVIQDNFWKKVWASNTYTAALRPFALIPSPSPSPSPSPTPSESPTPSPSPTPSESPTPSPSPTPSESPTPSPSPTPSESPTPSPSPTPSESPTPSPSPTPSESPTPSPSPTPSESPTPSPSPTPSESPTPTPSFSPTPLPTVPTATPTNTPTETPSPTPSPTASITPTATTTSTPTPSASAFMATPTPTATATPAPTPSPTLPPTGTGDVAFDPSGSSNVLSTNAGVNSNYLGQDFVNNGITNGVFLAKYNITDTSLVDVNASINVPNVIGQVTISIDGINFYTLDFDSNNPINMFQIPFQAGGYVIIKAPKTGTANLPPGSVNGQIKIGKGRLYDSTQINYPITPTDVRNGIYQGKNNGIDPALIYDPTIKRNRSIQSTCFITVTSTKKVGNKKITTASSYAGYDGTVYDPTINKPSSSNNMPWLKKI